MKTATPQASVREKFLVVSGLLITTVISTMLFTTRLDHWASSESFANFVVLNRSATAILVQLLSHILGMLHVYALRTTINLSSRAYLSNRSFSIGFIKFLSAVCGCRLDWSLTWLHWSALVLFMICTLFPAALWAGALTPIISTRNILQQITLPGYSNLTLMEGMPYHSNLRNIYQNNTNKGLFTYAPEFDQQGTMLDQAAAASNRTGGANAHSKMDRSNYIYTQRSYGVGASVGLTDDRLLDSTESYTYFELGFYPETSCIYNFTSNFYLGDNILPEDSGWLLEMFEAQGSLPFGNSAINFATVGFNAGAIVALIAASDNSSAPRHILAITTGSSGTGYYAPLNNVQCEMMFTATNFSVTVNRDNQTISVSPMEEVAWPSYGNVAVSGAVTAVSTMAQALCTTMYVSILGQTLIYNIANVEAFQGVSNSSTLLGVADAITSLLDNILVSYASAQLMVANEEISLETESQITAIVIGTSSYVFPIFALNLIICLIYLFEVYRTRGWRHLSSFDFMNISSVIVGTSIGGTAIADKALGFHKLPPAVQQGRKSAHTTDQINIRLDTTSASLVAVTLATKEKRRLDQQFGSSKGIVPQADDHEVLLQDFNAQNPPIMPQTGDGGFPFKDLTTRNPDTIEEDIVHSGASFSGSFPEYQMTDRDRNMSASDSIDDREVERPS